MSKYLRQNAERLVVKWMVYEAPDLIFDLNIKEWFWNKEGKALAWATLNYMKDKPEESEHQDYIMDYLNAKYASGFEPEDLELYLNIELPDLDTMRQVIKYFRLMGMLFEMYSKREGFSDKEVRAIQAVCEFVKKGHVDQRCEDIILKLYEKHLGLKFYNNKHKRDLLSNTLKQQEDKIINKYNGGQI